MRRFIMVLQMLVFAMGSASASAACTSKTSNGLTYYTANLSGFDPPTFDPNATPVGGVIYQATGTPVFTNKKNATATVNCNSLFSWSAYNTGVGMPDSRNIYPTSIPGIGIRIFANRNYFPYIDKSYLGFDTVTWNENFSITVELIRTGDITAGGTLNGAFAQYRKDDASGQVLVEFSFANPVVIRPQVPTCKVTTPVVNVSLGQVRATVFTGPGATSQSIPFELMLACSGGAAGTTTNAYVTMSDPTTPANTSTTLSLSKDSKATGVGVQILKNGTALGFGPDSNTPGNINQWKAASIAQGVDVVKIPLSARYIQTGSKVTGGSANALATFTMSYQ
ncbi:fimbrial protein [Burkholderia ubonensis]|uniref:Uncharacterized protein n=1 Tax=Burkholderia ubonensis TaxID=101571 RepID=A0A1R1J902_9BURK|nr:fimbrial protein [Burkholderia ubonensis]OMG71773.1 hypothetical protein BW685_19020 [Burkholderia ubonensis]